MKTNKQLINEIPRSINVRKLSSEEVRRLQLILLDIYKDVIKVAKKYNIEVLLAGGSCLGALRHNGFIPWDDDFDIFMKRKDFERFKEIFDKELSDKYELDSPNYEDNKVKNRFAKVLLKGTRFVEIEDSTDNPKAMIKIDIFNLENVPSNKILRTIKGNYCNLLMLIASSVQQYENKNHPLNKELRNKSLSRRIQFILGFIFSFKESYKWFNIVDKNVQYNNETGIVNAATGREHYFGEIHQTSSMFPGIKHIFEDIDVVLPADPNEYLCSLYGKNYMQLPPIDKREAHYVQEIDFGKY